MVQQLSIGGSTDIVPGVVANSAASSTDTTDQTNNDSSASLQQAADALFQLFPLTDANNLNTNGGTGGASNLAAADPFNLLGTQAAPANAGSYNGFTETTSPGYQNYGNYWLDILNTIGSLPGIQAASQSQTASDPSLSNTAGQFSLAGFGSDAPGYSIDGSTPDLNSSAGTTSIQTEQNVPGLTLGDLNPNTPQGAAFFSQYGLDPASAPFLGAWGTYDPNQAIGLSYQLGNGQTLGNFLAGNTNLTAEAADGTNGAMKQGQALAALQDAGDPYAVADAFETDMNPNLVPGGVTALAQAQTPLIAQAFGLDPSSQAAQELTDAFVTDAAQTNVQNQYQDTLTDQHAGWLDTADKIVGSVATSALPLVLSAGAATPAVIGSDVAESAAEAGSDLGSAAGSGFDAATNAATAADIYSAASTAIPIGVNAIEGQPLQALASAVPQLVQGALGSGVMSFGSPNSSSTSTDVSGTNTTSTGGGILSSMANTLGLSPSDLTSYAKDAAGAASVALPLAKDLLSSASSSAATPATTPASGSVASPAAVSLTPALSDTDTTDTSSTPDAPGSPLLAPSLFNPSQSSYTAPVPTSSTLGGGLGNNLGSKLNNSELANIMTSMGMANS